MLVSNTALEKSSTPARGSKTINKHDAFGLPGSVTRESKLYYRKPTTLYTEDKLCLVDYLIA